MKSSYSLECVVEGDELSSAEIKAAWKNALAKTHNFRAAFQTPAWVRYRSSSGNCISIAIVRDSELSIVGLIPLYKSEYKLAFGTFSPFRFHLPIQGVSLLGNSPLASPDPQLYREFFEALSRDARFDSLVLWGESRTSDFGFYLDKMNSDSDSKWIAYRPEPDYSYYYIQMPATFEEYCLLQFTSKERRKLKREVRLLQNQNKAPLELVTITSADQVADFVREAGTVAEKSWQRQFVGYPVDRKAERHEMLKEMAELGWLRAYILRSGENLYAYGIGFQINGTYYFFETAYDPQWSDRSPGKVLLYLMLQEMFTIKTPAIFNFGPWDAPFKRWFANKTGKESIILVQRRRFGTQLKFGMHRLVRHTVRFLKKICRSRTFHPAKAS
jgi:hypothetical protein